MIPKPFRDALSRDGVRKALSNMSWVTGGRIVRILGGVLVGAWIARNLGPTDFGLLGHAAAVVGMFGVTVHLGTDQLTFRELVRRPDDEVQILASASVIRSVGAVIAIGALTIMCATVSFQDVRSSKLILVLALCYSVSPFQVAATWFRSQTNARPAVVAGTAAYVLGLAVKAVLVSIGVALVYFPITDVAVAILTGALVIAAFRREGKQIRWSRASLQESKRLLREGWPLLVAGAAILIYMKIDVIMLEQMLGEHGPATVGQYSVATRLSEVWYFIPIALVSSVLPKVIQTRERDHSLYMRRITQLLSFTTACSILLCVATALLGGAIIEVLFGSEYAEAAPVLMVHMWALVFVAWGAVGGNWLVTEGLTRLSMLRTIAGAITNVALNLIFIPTLGAMGAAISTVASYACSAWLFNALTARTRPLFWAQLSSLRLKGLVS